MPPRARPAATPFMRSVILDPAPGTEIGLSARAILKTLTTPMIPDSIQYRTRIIISDQSHKATPMSGIMFTATSTAADSQRITPMIPAAFLYSVS